MRVRPVIVLSYIDGETDSQECGSVGHAMDLMRTWQSDELVSSVTVYDERDREVARWDRNAGPCADGSSGYGECEVAK